MLPIPKPQPSEYAPYASAYISQLPDDGRVLQHLRDNLASTLTFIRSFPVEKTGWAHRDGEWTIKEILIHISDTERIVAYRALRIARGDETPLAGFEQDGYVPLSGANARALESILTEYTAVRNATLALFESLDEPAWLRQGTASNNPLSVRAAAYFIAGHELHHVASIRENYA